MHYPGDFVRRAAANINKVSNTVSSSVASTVTHRFIVCSTKYDGRSILKLKCNCLALREGRHLVLLIFVIIVGMRTLNMMIAYF